MNRFLGGNRINPNNNNGRESELNESKMSKNSKLELINSISVIYNQSQQTVSEYGEI